MQIGRTGMSAATLPIPGIVLGSYPERRKDAHKTRYLAALQCRLRAPARLESRDHGEFVAKVRCAEKALGKLSAPAYAKLVRGLRARLRRDGFTPALTAEGFALVAEAARRQLGVQLFDTQITAARIMLDNRLAEMATGEGKTLAALLTVATAALAGVPVHVITANDYLVARDADHLRPVYELLGLRVGAVTQPMTPAQRGTAYACDVTYCTAKELVFDYLRDRLTLGPARGELRLRIERMAAAPSDGAAEATAGPTMLRGLCMAVVDEADSILIDEARTPLIISQPRANADQTEFQRQALKLAHALVAEQDFHVNRLLKSIELLESGRAKVAAGIADATGIWRDQRLRDEAVTLALSAVHFYARDRHYLIDDGKVVMIDETTGRVAAGRVWSRGLQQLIELKEGCEVSGELQTVAQITYQRFFPRYLRLAGMSGTLSEARAELLSVYGLHVSVVTLRRPSRRVVTPPRLYTDRETRWQAVVKRIAEVHRAGRPVLVGTDSVADSEQLSERLTAAGLPHCVLNARQDEHEARIIAQAGGVDAITVTTNIAGRGTDIALAPGVAERGGLHVICCQHNGSRRIDRQLHGRCARQGDPGSVETFLSSDEGLFARYSWHRPLRLWAGLKGSRNPLPPWLSRLVCVLPQLREERQQHRERARLMKQDDKMERVLAIGGPGE